MNIYKKILIVTAFLFFSISFCNAEGLLGDDTVDSGVPLILPEFINEGADQQIKNWQKIFGDQFVDIINAMEAVKTGDVQTFVQSGVNIIKVAPRILPKLGLDLIIPINENYLGNIEIDPLQEITGIEFDDQVVEIEGMEELDLKNLVLDLAINGYSSDFVKVKKLIDEGTIEIIGDEIVAKTKSKINIDEGKIYIENQEGNEKKEVNKLPSYALREVRTRNKRFVEENISLEIKDGKPIYNIDGYIDGRIMWIIPIKADMQVEYDAEKGLIDTIKKPWWEVFIF